MYRQLKAAVAKTGVPRAIISDGGGSALRDRSPQGPSDHGLAVSTSSTRRPVC